MQGYYTNTLLVDPVNPDQLIAGGITSWRSTDGGLTWHPEWEFSGGPGTHVDHHAMVYRPGKPSEVWVATDGGVYALSEIGGAWIERNTGLVTAQFYSVCFPGSSKSIAYAGAQDHAVLRYSGSTNWEEFNYGDGGICNCDQADPRHVYGEREFGHHFVTWDGQETWTDIDTGLTGQGRFIAPTDLDPTNPERLFTATSDGIFRTTDGGISWEKVGEGNDIVSISVSPLAPNIIWALERSTGVVRHSADGGNSWTSTQAAPFTGIGGTKIVADPRDSSKAFCTFLTHPAHPPVILMTIDQGVRWQDVSGNLIGHSINTLAVDPSLPTDWYVGTNLGVWASRDGGRDWEPFGAGLPYAVVSDLTIQASSRKLHAATHGRGLWETDLASAWTLSSSRPSSLFLDRASANPSTRMVGLRYAGRSPGNVKVFITDVFGRVIAKLAEDPGDGLVRTISWDSRGQPAGVYFAVLASGSDRLTRKVVIVR
jgi:photosystem II stability/assembly factor-like uncharacterized protein